MLSSAIEAGCNLIFCGGDYTNLILAWQQLLETIKGGLNR